jgi:hypothetical protein
LCLALADWSGELRLLLGEPTKKSRRDKARRPEEMVCERQASTTISSPSAQITVNSSLAFVIPASVGGLAALGQESPPLANLGSDGATRGTCGATLANVAGVGSRCFGVRQQGEVTGMPLASIRRRVDRLQGLDMFVTVINYPPLTSPEIEAIANRVLAGEPLTKEEVDRLQFQSPIIDGELLITAHRGTVFIKRYGGLDLAEI